MLYNSLWRKGDLERSWQVLLGKPPDALFLILKRTTQRSSAVPASAGFVLGRNRFAQISAVEGIVLTPDMRETLDRFDREGLSAAETQARYRPAFHPDALTGEMYDSNPDPYCYPTSSVLKNRLDICDRAALGRGSEKQ